jgi:MYXO-CTERM domain-containing protein
MSLRHIPLFLSSAAAIAVLGFAGEARANHLDACGGLWLEADAAGRCEVVPKESCETQCQPVATERVCASRLFQECESSCTLTAEVECQGSCESSCGTECTTTATDQPPNCMGLCMSDCQQTVTDSCGDTDHGQCRSSGAHCCSENCETQCDQTTETECAPVCTSACSGSCVGRANVDCQVECQAVEFQSCTDTVVQECHEECQTTGAAIFCDGHFLATGGDLQACADALKAEFEIELDVDIDVDVDVSGGDDNGDEDDGIRNSLSCSVADPIHTAPFGLLVLVAIGGWRMRRGAREKPLS